jgi:hypothetical protein
MEGLFGSQISQAKGIEAGSYGDIQPHSKSKVIDRIFKQHNESSTETKIKIIT